MCNGANLAYTREAFYDVDGFKGIDQIASGDDMLLMQKISARYPGRIGFLKSKDAIITTQAAESWTAFFNQRIRWASKAGKYKDVKITSVLLLVYLCNLFILIFFFAGLFNPKYFLYFLLLAACKTVVEFSFVKRVARFFALDGLMVYFPFFQPMHILYTVIAGWLGLFGQYKWKERKLS
jgi:cellulose synthase/poly-beta-1,6-N-acetylglucosamine synthase-like glycosyltransferase